MISLLIINFTVKPNLELHLKGFLFVSQFTGFAFKLWNSKEQNVWLHFASKKDFSLKLEKVMLSNYANHLQGIHKAEKWRNLLKLKCLWRGQVGNVKTSALCKWRAKKTLEFGYKMSSESITTGALVSMKFMNKVWANELSGSNFHGLNTSTAFFDTQIKYRYRLSDLWSDRSHMQEIAIS